MLGLTSQKRTCIDARARIFDEITCRAKIELLGLRHKRRECSDQIEAGEDASIDKLKFPLGEYS